jgi:virulence factor Mce-like protein
VRRLLLIGVLAAAIATPVTIALTAPASGSSSATFDVIFDDARGLIAGQLVKVAGAKAGQIQHISVTDDFKARVEASIDSRFMPLHANATCTIRPEGLIAENYIDCDPGTASSPVLKGTDSKPPTVPVQNTTEPVGLLDLFNIFNAPTRERFSIILDELGIGTSGEGQNFNDIIRRANPALAYARQAIGVLDSQRSQLIGILDATNTIAAQAATHTGALESFLDRSASLTSVTADHASALSQAIAKLPGLLAAAQPALDKLDGVALAGTPLVNEIHAATPSLNTLADRLGPFVTAAKPALAQLGTALTRAVPAIRDSTPLVAKVVHYLKVSQPSNVESARIFTNLQQKGFVENFLGLVYYLTALTGRYDELGHLGVAFLIAPNNGLCDVLATTPVPGCSANYGPGTTTPARAPQQTTTPAKSTTPTQTPPSTTAGTPITPSTPAAPTTSTPGTTTATPSTPATPTTSTPNPVTSSVSHTLQGLLHYLFK